MLRRFLYLLLLSVTATALSSCREGYNIPFYVGCAPDCEPFCYVDQNGQLKGIEIDIINAIGENQGIWFDFILSDQHGVLSELNQSKHDMDCGISMIEWTTDRENYYSFVNPAYFTSSLALAVAKNSSVTSLSDLNGKVLAVKKYSLAEEYAELVAGQYGYTIKTFDTCDEMVKAVENGQADACQEHYEMIRYRINKKGAGLRIVDPGVTNLSFAIITQRDEDETLRGYLYNGLAKIYLNGRLTEIIDNYLK